MNASTSEPRVEDDRQDNSGPIGVYYHANDYVGFGLRLAIFVIDATALIMGLVALAVLLEMIGLQSPAVNGLIVVFAIWCYVVLLKRSELGTLGYRLTRCRLVTLQGNRPPIWRMTLRMLMWIFGPFWFGFDFIWCGIDGDRQTLRDRYAGTCVIRKNATPIGHGQIQLSRYFALGYVFFYPHVVHESTSG